MTNTTGGRIYIGVHDDRRVLGKQRTQAVDDIIRTAALNASNPGQVRIQDLDVAGVPVIVVEVSARPDEVAQTSDGRVLIRRGGRNVALFGADLWHLMSSRTLRQYEDSDSGVPITAVDERTAEAIADAHGWTDSSPHARWAERGLLHASGSLTIAGALVLTDPAQSLGTSKFHIDIRSYEADESGSYVRREIVRGTVQQQIESGTDWVLRDIGTEMVITGARRHDVPRLPRRTVREAVANAVAHRDYASDGSPCVIEVRPSLVRIKSPGGLPASVSIERLRESQAARNHTVIDVLRRLGLAEDSGQGIDVMQDQMRDEFLQEPAFTEGPDHFTVELPLGGLISVSERGWLAEHERQGRLQARDRLLLLAVVREGEVTNARARELLTIDSVEARRRLQSLRNVGLLVQNGTRGRAFYTAGVFGPDRGDHQLLLDAARDQPLTNSRVRELLTVDRAKAPAILRRMVDEQELIQVGERRGTRYVLPPVDAVR